MASLPKPLAQSFYTGRRLNFKVPDYLQLAGLIWITSLVTKAGADLYQWEK